MVPVEGGGRPESTLRTLLGTLLCSLVSRLSPPNGKESLVTLGVSNRGLPAAGFWWYQSDCRMIHVTNFLQLQVTLPRPFDAIAWKSRYNDGIQHGISSDHHETLLSCVWQGRRAKKKGKCSSQSLAWGTESLSDCRIFLGLTVTKICPNLPARSVSPTSTKLLANTIRLQLRTELVNALIETTLRYRWTLCWGLKEHLGGDATSTCACSPTRIPTPKRILPTTPQSTKKPTPKRARSCLPELQTAIEVQQPFPHPIAQTLFEHDGNRSQVKGTAMLIHLYTPACEYILYNTFLPFSQQLAEP